MFTIEKNDLLSLNKFVRYAKVTDNGKITITITPDIEAEILRVKIRVKELPITNKITFNLIEIPMSNASIKNHISKDDFWAGEELPINFCFEPNLESQEVINEIIPIICDLLEGVKDIILRWIADDGLYFLLKNDASKRMSLLVEAHYRELKKNNQIPCDISELDAKKEIEEQLSEFYCKYVSSFEELEPITKISELASKNIVKNNLTK